MSKEELIKTIVGQLKLLTEYDDKDLTHRPKWGEIHFQGAEPDIKSVLSIVLFAPALEQH